MSHSATPSQPVLVRPGCGFLPDLSTWMTNSASASLTTAVGAAKGENGWGPQGFGIRGPGLPPSVVRFADLLALRPRPSALSVDVYGQFPAREKAAVLLLHGITGGPLDEHTRAAVVGHLQLPGGQEERPVQADGRPGLGHDIPIDVIASNPPHGVDYPRDPPDDRRGRLGSSGRARVVRRGLATEDRSALSGGLGLSPVSRRPGPR